MLHDQLYIYTVFHKANKQCGETSNTIILFGREKIQKHSFSCKYNNMAVYTLGFENQ